MENQVFFGPGGDQMQISYDLNAIHGGYERIAKGLYTQWGRSTLLKKSGLTIESRK